MKAPKLLLVVLMLYLFSNTIIAQYPVISWRFANQIVIPGTPNIAQFDVELTCDQSGTFHSDMQVYFDYNTLAFGSNIVLNNKITYTKLELMDGNY